MTADTQPVEEEGRELDAAVAREVFGLDVRGPEEHRGYWIHGESPFAYEFRSTDGDRGGDLNGVPRFSEEWGPAGRVVGSINEQGLRVVLRQDWHGSWEALVFRQSERVSEDGFRRSAPLAICRAALRAVRDE